MSYECHDLWPNLEMPLHFHTSNEELVIIKANFKDLSDTFWMDEYHVANRTNCDEIGTCFGHFLLPSCTLNFQRPDFQLVIGDKNYYTFCLPALTRMFGLSQKGLHSC